jgi:hypothetical protein
VPSGLALSNLEQRELSTLFRIKTANYAMDFELQIKSKKPTQFPKHEANRSQLPAVWQEQNVWITLEEDLYWHPSHTKVQLSTCSFSR